MITKNVNQRAATRQLTGEVRAYFAPVDRATSAPTVFDPATLSGFDMEIPPAPWIAAGRVAAFARTSHGKVEPLRAGRKGAIAAQCRNVLDARVEFEFLHWGKLQMLIACGAQHMNVLAAEAGATPKPCGGTARPPVAVLAGSTAQEIVFGAGAVNSFAVGDIIAVDVDYQQNVGYVGTGVPGAYVKAAADVGFSPDYVRRVTLNVGRIESVSTTSVRLARPLIGGAPLATAQAQKVVGFVDREGGSFFQEWSALFVAESEAGGRLSFFYPRLRAAAPAGEQQREIFSGIEERRLRASLVALPYTDTLDAEQAVCFRAYAPWRGAAI